MSVFNAQQQPLAAIVAALSNSGVVALGDAHWYGTVFDELQSLLLNDEVLVLSQHLVLEMGGRRHQAWLNDYVAGHVPEDAQQLQAVLLDSLVFTAWLAPHYLTFLRQVRATNLARQARALPALALHLTEPEFAWDDVRSAADYCALFQLRDQGIYDRVATLRADHQRVLVLAGAWHLLQQSKPSGPTSFGALMSTSLPGALVSIWPHMQAPLDAYLADCAVPSLLDLASHELGEQPFSTIAALPPARLTAGKWPPVRQLLDGYLYLGPQRRRQDYDFACWHGVDAARLRQRARFMNPRQQQQLATVLARESMTKCHP